MYRLEALRISLIPLLSSFYIASIPLYLIFLILRSLSLSPFVSSSLFRCPTLSRSLQVFTLPLQFLDEQIPVRTKCNLIFCFALQDFIFVYLFFFLSSFVLPYCYYYWSCTKQIRRNYSNTSFWVYSFSSCGMHCCCCCDCNSCCLCVFV